MPRPYWPEPRLCRPFLRYRLQKRELKSGAAKVAVFAYDRQTHKAVWQSGIEQAGSNSRDTWVLGIGPFQHGTIYGATRFAGKRLFEDKSDDGLAPEQRQGVGSATGHFFANALRRKPDADESEREGQEGGEVVTASANVSSPAPNAAGPAPSQPPPAPARIDTPLGV